MKAFYGSAELVFEDVSMLMGARSESASQKLEYTKQPAANNTLNSDDLLPVVSVNWMATEELQLRASMSQTLSRPGITERSQSVQYDPETDDQIFGNPTLKISKITNFDVRAEYYFSDYESITLALFHKDIIDPIERTIPNASGSASDGSTFRNEDSALLQGLEVDFRKDVIDEYNWLGFISGNYTYINAEVVLSEETASLEKVNKRKLQGQSENLANIQFGVDHLGTGQNLTLLVNYFDDRIYKASRSLAPEVEEGRMSIDMVYQYEIDEDTSLKAKAVNITDEKIVFSRDSKKIESYYNGIGFNMTLSKNF
jgi:outer membrane receptor protein involved in Fe transport